mmetsp:Transcript_1069/g.4227  ORF Transcript_1069/g.4227 Transcript_1069/m.4227 type:complete len:210 (-) Transcript_1069:238-867(-)
MSLGSARRTRARARPRAMPVAAWPACVYASPLPVHSATKCAAPGHAASSSSPASLVTSSSVQAPPSRAATTHMSSCAACSAAASGSGCVASSPSSAALSAAMRSSTPSAVTSSAEPYCASSATRRNSEPPSDHHGRRSAARAMSRASSGRSCSAHTSARNAYGRAKPGNHMRLVGSSAAVRPEISSPRAKWPRARPSMASGNLPTWRVR